MLLSSKKDVSTRVRDEDDEEEELINIKHVHCDSSGQPGTVTDSSPGSEQEDATADYRAKATPLVSRFQALGDDRHPSSATTSRPCRSRCQSASMTDPLSEASMSSLHSHHPSILPFSTMVDLATAKAENITGLYFAKQMNANLRRSLPSLRTSMASTPSPPFADRGKLTTMNPVTAAVDTNELDLRTESQPGSPMTPFPGPSPEQHDYPFAFANRSALTSSLSAPSAIHIQITSSSPSPVSSRSAVAVGGCEPAREKPLVMKGKRMAFEQGHPAYQSGNLLGIRRKHGQEWQDGSARKIYQHLSFITNVIVHVQPCYGCQCLRKGQHRRHHSASHFFHLSSLRQHSPAQFNLALCYEHGQGGVSQDLGKAIHFYQQAAAQGHSKASYNLGCIYFHRGLVHKAIGWFELASKCRVRDLETIQRAERDVDKEEQLPQQSPGDEVMRCPPWKANYLAALSSFVLTGTSPVTEWSSFSETSFSLSSSSSAAAIQDLLEQLHGPSVAVEQATVATSGPTAPYLPAMLTLALLCYQGVPATTGTKTTAAEAAEEAKVSMKDGHAKCTNRSNGQDTSVFLRRNSKQAILVLKKLITIAPSSLVNGVEGSSEPPAIQGREKSKSSTFRAQDTSSPSSSSYSTSCPNLPTPSSTVPLVVKDSVSFIGGMTGSASDGEKDPSLPLQPTPQSNQRSFLSPQRRSQNQMPFTTSTNDNARHCRSHPSLPRDAEQGRQATQPRLPPMPQNIDDHEAWAVCLARHLLQYWQQQDASSSFSTDTASAQAATSAAAATPRERIQRYHLLHMTNPTNSKMLYNLGLVYDMYLNAPAVASRCYLSAYEKSVVAVAAEKDPFGVLSGDSCATSPLASFTCSKSSAITRINSAWNLGVLYAKDRQWAVGRDWFLRVQQELMTTTPTMATDSSCVREKDTHRAVDTNNIHLQSDRPRADALLLVSKNQQHRPQQARQIQRELRTDAERVEAVLTLMDQQLIQENVAR
ncbi:hypothetical protein BGZ73_004461 [Actinomortierella ambigua]|nr:hypothetical protein BGZ73_004461 [Actinomortierella ambigua]